MHLQLIHTGTAVGGASAVDRDALSGQHAGGVDGVGVGGLLVQADGIREGFQDFVADEFDQLDRLVRAQGHPAHALVGEGRAQVVGQHCGADEHGEPVVGGYNPQRGRFELAGENGQRLIEAPPGPAAASQEIRDAEPVMDHQQRQHAPRVIGFTATAVGREPNIGWVAVDDQVVQRHVQYPAQPVENGQAHPALIAVFFECVESDSEGGVEFFRGQSQVRGLAADGVVVQPWPACRNTVLARCSR